jgi:hypothetical protein
MNASGDQLGSRELHLTVNTLLHALSNRLGKPIGVVPLRA